MQSIWDLVPGQSSTGDQRSPMEIVSTNKAGRTERFVVPPLARLKTQLIPGTLIIDPSDNNSSVATTFTNASSGTPQSNCAISPPSSARPSQPCQYFIADLPLASQLGSPDPTPFALKGGYNLHVSRWFTKDKLTIEIVNAKSKRLRASRPGSPPLMLSACHSAPNSPCLEALPPAALSANDIHLQQEREQEQTMQVDGESMPKSISMVWERQPSLASSTTSFSTASQPFSPHTTTSTIFPSGNISPKKVIRPKSSLSQFDSPYQLQGQLVTPFGSLTASNEYLSPGFGKLHHVKSNSSIQGSSGVATPTEQEPDNEEEEYTEYSDETADQACLGDLLFNPPWMLRKYLSQKELNELKIAFGEAGFHGVIGYGVSMDLVETLLELMAVDVRHGEPNLEPSDESTP